MAQVLLEIPDDLMAQLTVSGQEAAHELRVAAAFSLASRGELTTGQAARLAGLPYPAFLEAAAHARIELFPVDIEDLKQELARPVHASIDLNSVKQELERATSGG